MSGSVRGAEEQSSAPTRHFGFLSRSAPPSKQWKNRHPSVILVCHEPGQRLDPRAASRQFPPRASRVVDERAFRLPMKILLTQRTLSEVGSARRAVPIRARTGC
jgi:hypothetical protein